MWLAFLLLTVFAAWLLQYFLFQKRWHKGLNVRVEFESPSIYEGDTSTLKETVTNDKGLPLAAVSVRLSFSRNLEFVNAAKENSGISDQTYKRDIFALLPKQQLTRRLPFVGKKRGCYSIMSANISAYDYFFQKGYYRSYPQSTQLYVYPRPVDVSRIALISRAISGTMLSQNRLFPDPFEFSGIREYRREDPMNRINWKASARTGDLMVNQFDATTEYSITILLDLADPYIIKYESLLEESIRIAASLCSHLLQKEMPSHVLSNCCVISEEASFNEPLNIKISATSGKITPLLQALACLDISRTMCDMDALIREKIKTASTGKIYVVISKNQNAELISAIHELNASGNQVLWVLPIMSYDMDKKYQDSRITILPWEVTP